MKNRGAVNPYVTVLLSCLVIFVYGMLSSLLGTIIPGLATALHLTNAQIGMVALAQGLGLASTSVVAGALMDKQGKKIGVILGLGATLAGLILLGSSRGMIAVSFAMFILGCGGSLVIVAANAIVSDVGDEKRAAALNFLNVFSGLGGLATPFIAANLLGSNASRTVVFGIVTTVLVLCLALFVPLSKVSVESGQRTVNQASLFSNPALYLLSAVTLLYTACEFGIWNWLPKFLIVSGMSSTVALNVLSLGFACGLLCGRIVATSVLWRISPSAVVIASSILMAVTTYMILQPEPVWLTFLLVFLAGVAMAPVFPTTIAIVARLFKEQSATAIGFAITCGFSGLMLSSPLIGWLSGPNPQGIGRGLLIVPVLSICIFAILVLSRGLFKQEPNVNLPKVEVS
jgi:MFS transporter, FHS family, L-fucose permease